MSEDLSSDEDWRVSTANLNYDVRSQNYDPQSHLKCWECGKRMTDLTSLVEHYKSHNIEATCNICKITFCRLISLATHLENVHAPPRCSGCRQVFGTVWELNKHAETPCVVPKSRKKGSSAKAFVKHKGKKSHNLTNKMTVEKSTNTAINAQDVKMEQGEGLETSNEGLEYTQGEDSDDSDEKSATSASDVGPVTRSLRKNSRVVDDESDGDSDSSSTDCSSDPPTPPPPVPPTTIPIPPHKNLMCIACGRGPFRSLKLHQLHCSRLNLKYQCFQCKLVFLSEKSLKEHHMPLYSCHVCGQVFSHETMLDSHPCPKENRSSLVLFCPEAMPKVCNICKSFFTSEKTLLAHVARVHVSVVSTKVCIISNPSLLNDEKGSAGDRTSDDQSALSDPNQALNGKLPLDQARADSRTAPVKSSSSSSRPDAPPVPDKVGDLPGMQADQLPKPPSPHSVSPPSGAETPSSSSSSSSAAAAAVPDPEPPASPTILAMFENYSLASLKRTGTSWRLKATYPCRQCGAVLRHASLIISHRYLHRGQRSHRCQCGRSFRHRLHLLRHCVQHAEAVSYICASCGDTFTGAKLLARHLKGKSPKASCHQPKRKSKGNRKCRMTFACDCGLLFFRPSAYIWHQLKNKAKS